GIGSAVKSAVKQDIANTKSSVKSTVSDVKSAAKQDIQNKANAQTSTAAAKKAEKLKQINSKLDELNKELTTVKNDKNITETERTLKTKTLQRQIDFYNNQKKALQ
ncbi:hypothetical protein IJ531_02325, partial [bacterium]|nr:hypothetical protein [bacterium]